METKNLEKQYIEDNHTDFENFQRGCFFVLKIIGIVTFCIGVIIVGFILAKHGY